MEIVLDELKKIEDEAAKIRLGASQKAEEIVTFARQKALKLIDDAEKNAEETVGELWKEFDHAKDKRRGEVKWSTESKIKEMRKLAIKRLDAVADFVFRKAVGESEG
jgi:vacuolar-type H+-ATPase subunit H